MSFHSLFIRGFSLFSVLPEEPEGRMQFGKLPSPSHAVLFNLNKKKIFQIMFKNKKLWGFGLLVINNITELNRNLFKRRRDWHKMIIRKLIGKATKLNQNKQNFASTFHKRQTNPKNYAESNKKWQAKKIEKKRKEEEKIHLREHLFYVRWHDLLKAISHDCES